MDKRYIYLHSCYYDIVYSLKTEINLSLEIYIIACFPKNLKPAAGRSISLGGPHAVRGSRFSDPCIRAMTCVYRNFESARHRRFLKRNYHRLTHATPRFEGQETCCPPRQTCRCWQSKKKHDRVLSFNVPSIIQNINYAEPKAKALNANNSIDLKEGLACVTMIK